MLPPALVQSVAGIVWIDGGEHWVARPEVRTFVEWGIIWLYAAVAAFFAIRIAFPLLWPFPFGALDTQHGGSAALLRLDVAAILLGDTLEREGPEMLG